MKKLFILSLFIANYTFAQSVTIVPSNVTNTESVKIKKMEEVLTIPVQMV